VFVRKLSKLDIGVRPPSVGEKIVVFLILVFPVMGTFFAPETYFTPQDFSLQQNAVDVGFPFGRLVFMLILIWLILQYLRFPWTMIGALRRSFFPILFVIWMIATALWSADPGASINRSGRVLILVLFAIYFVERYSLGEVLSLLTMAGAIAIIASVVAVVLIPAYGLSSIEGYRGAWRGATIHKNALGALMSTIFIIGYCSLRTNPKDRLRCVFIILGSLFLVVMSRSATSIVVTLITVPLIWIIRLLERLRSGGERLVVMTIACLSLPLVFFGQSAAADILDLLGRDSTLTGRTQVWQIVILMIEKNPIWGYGSSFWAIDSPGRQYAWAYLNWATPHAHNALLDIWLQLGVFGLIIACCMFAICLWKTARLLLQGMQPLLIVWSVMVITTMLRGLTETNLVEPGSIALFWITMSYASLSRVDWPIKTHCAKSFGRTEKN
jgi:exopolysaccharide production protein ExoQ